MPRYGRDYDRWNRMPRYDRDFGPGPRRRSGSDYGGMRSDGWGSDWGSFPGESGWFGEETEGYPHAGYDVGFRGPPSRYDRMMRGRARLAYGTDYTGRQMGYEGPYSGFSGGYGRSGMRGQRGMARSGGMRSMRVSEIMTERPECVTPESTLSEVAARMRDLDVGIIPVVGDQDGCRLEGVITDRDIAVRAVADGKDGKVRVRDYMTSDVEAVDRNDTIEDAIEVMKRDQVRRVPVTDRDGRLVGIISQADLVVQFAADRPHREQMVEGAIERISEPARPRRAPIQASGRGSSRDDRENPFTQPEDPFTESDKQS